MKLFHISKNNAVTVLTNRSYRDEEIKGFGEAMLEQFVMDYPEIIPAEEIDQENPPKFLVIKNQAGVTPGSMDILMLDNNGIPTVIEAKLVDNREIRRPVLAQGLEYLSSLRNEWNPERFILEGEKFWETKSVSFLDKFEEAFEFPYDEEFAQKLKANLETARMRLIIVADKIPTKLRTVIEFLNDTSSFDVFGVEVHLFAEPKTEDIILSPHIIGVSKKAKERKQNTPGTKWTEERFFEALSSRVDDQGLKLAKDLYVFAQEITGGPVYWGVGNYDGSFTAKIRTRGELWSLFSVYTYGKVLINGWVKAKLEKHSLNIADKYRIMANELFGIDFSEKDWDTKWPMIALDTLLKDNANAFVNGQ